VGVAGACTLPGKRPSESPGPGALPPAPSRREGEGWLPAAHGATSSAPYLAVFLLHPLRLPVAVGREALGEGRVV